MHRSIAAVCCAASASVVVGVALALPVYAGPVRNSVGGDLPLERGPAGHAPARARGQAPAPQSSHGPGNDPTVNPPTTEPPTTTSPPSPTATATTPPPVKPKPTKTAPSPTQPPKRTTAPPRPPVKKTPAYAVPTYSQPPESRPTLEPGVLEEEEETADETAAPVAVRSTPSTQARRDIAFIIIGVGSAALLGLGGIAGLYFTRARPVAAPARPPADAEDGYGAEGDGTERG